MLATDEWLERLIELGINKEQIHFCHNYYPMRYSGMTKEDLIEANAVIHRHAFTVAGFIPSKTHPRIACGIGLPTAERWREMDTHTVIQETFLFGLVDIYYGDDFADISELKLLCEADPNVVTFRFHPFVEGEYFKVPSMLGHWNFLGGEAPEILGVFGTAERAQTMTDSFIIDRERDILYSVSTNHNHHSPDVIAIDLKTFRMHMHEKGDVSRDKLLYAPGAPEYKSFADGWHETKVNIAKYAPNIKAEKIEPVRLWREFSHPEFKEMPVVSLEFVSSNCIEGVCGKDEFFRFTITDGKLISVEPTAPPTPKQSPAFSELPAYPGRQWRANATCSCEWLDYANLVGTEDGFLAKVNADGSVYSIGPAISQGPIRDLCSNIETGIAYGVGGDTDDVGNLFSYSEKEGLKYLGVTICDRADDDIGTCASFYPTCCAISPDGRTVAVGVGDRLSCVYIYTNPYFK